MRFENLSYSEKRAFLQRLHKRLNRQLFYGQLKPIDIIVENLSGPNGEKVCFAVYKKTFQYERGELQQSAKISISYEGEDLIAKQHTQKDQAYIVTMLLLHEMIHQYCAENGIDEGNHNENWQRAAADHGLHSVYKNGVIQEEDLQLITLIVISSLRIY